MDIPRTGRKPTRSADLQLCHVPWPGIAGSVSALRRVLPGGRLVLLMRRGGVWHWRVIAGGAQWMGSHESKRIAARNAAFAGA